MLAEKVQDCLPVSRLSEAAFVTWWQAYTADQHANALQNFARRLGLSETLSADVVGPELHHAKLLAEAVEFLRECAPLEPEIRAMIAARRQV